MSMNTRNRKQNKYTDKPKDIHKSQNIPEKKINERINYDDYNDSDSEISSDNEELETPRFINDHKYDSKELKNPDFIKDNKYDSKETCKNKIKIILACTMMIIIIIPGLFCWKCLCPSSPVSGYLEGFNKLMLEFPSQTKITWKTLNNSLEPQILRSESVQKPSVIILVGQRDKVDHFLATLIKLVLNKCSTYRQTIATENADDLKSYLIEFLASLVGNGTRCAYLPEIDNIPPSLGPLLHGFTDELHAKYKQMVYIFSLITNPNDENLESPPETVKDAEHLLMNRLSSKWEHEQGSERFASLYVRLQVNVVNIT